MTNRNEPFRQDMLDWLLTQNPDGDFDDETAVARGAKPLTIEDGIALATAMAKAEVAGDVRAGRIPASVRSFSELHDYVDANAFGGAFDWPCLSSDRDDGYQQAFADFWNAVQNNVDAWIKAGGLRQRGPGAGRA